MQGLVFIARTSPPYFVTYYLGPSHAPLVPCGTGVRDVRAWTSKRAFTPDPVSAPEPSSVFMSVGKFCARRSSLRPAAVRSNSSSNRSLRLRTTFEPPVKHASAAGAGAAGALRAPGDQAISATGS